MRKSLPIFNAFTREGAKLDSINLYTTVNVGACVSQDYAVHQSILTRVVQITVKEPACQQYAIMNVYFIRHNVLPSETRELLVQNGVRVGIAYGWKTSIDPAYYEKRGVQAMKLMNQLPNEEALICATFGKEELIVGKPIPGSTVTILDGTGQTLEPIKCIPLRDTKVFSFKRYPVLATLMPRQGTIGRARNLERIILPLYENGKLDRTAYALSPSQLEVLCFEYLRHKNLLEFLTLPIGRTLRNVDIAGIRGSKLVYAQVTFAKTPGEMDRKSQSLINFAGDDEETYFFAPKHQVPESAPFTFVAIEDVYSYFENVNSGRFLDALSGLSEPVLTTLEA